MILLHVGDQLDHYVIEKLIARSGMASIFRGTDTRTGRPVAIKIPGSELALARRGGASRTLLDFIGEVKDDFGNTQQNLREATATKTSTKVLDGPAVLLRPQRQIRTCSRAGRRAW